MIGLIDYGMGNILSVLNAFEYIGADIKVCHKSSDIKDKDKLILPGVGAFSDCIKSLDELGFIDELDNFVIQKKKPILGICLGMQVMASKSYENGIFDGLNWIDSEVVPINTKNLEIKIPHIGWNSLHNLKRNNIFYNIEENFNFYFVHSYFMKCNNMNDVIAECEYGTHITAAVNKENIFGVQFHPEKSQDYGLRIIENFDNL